MTKTKNLNNTTYGLYDPWNYYFRNCTSFVAWKTSSVLGVNVSGWGNAKDWDTNRPAQYDGGSSPEQYDIAQSDTPSTFGHVGFVEKVNKDANGVVISIEVSEYNKAGTGVYSNTTYNIKAPDGKFWRNSAQTAKWDTYIDLNGTGSTGTDNYDDFVIHRPSSSGLWSVKKGPNAPSYIAEVQHGGYAGDIPLLGDINGDGKQDFVIYRQGMWYVKDKNGDLIGPGQNGIAHGGWAGDIPLIGNFNNDQYDDFVIYRPSTGLWAVRPGPTGITSGGSWFIGPGSNGMLHGGWAGDVPLIADIDGNGYDDFIIYRPSQGRWYTKSGPTGSAFISDVTHGGQAGDIPLVGNFNYDQYDDFVIYRPSNGLWGVRPGPGGTLPNGSTYIGPGSNGLTHGIAGDIPLVGDIDGNGADDYIIYRPSAGRWLTKAGPTGSSWISDIVHGGWSGDKPFVGNFGF